MKQLSEQTGESAEWPTDAAFGEAWRSKHVYQTLNKPKVVHILKRLNATFLGSKNELVSVDGALTVEHILPQNWIEHWPLQDGSKGLTGTELWTAEPQDAKATATRIRNAVL